MCDASWRRALRTSMGYLLRLRRIQAHKSVFRDQAVHALRSLDQRFFHTTPCCTADHVVAIERGLERNRRKKVGLKFAAELAQFFEAQIAKLATLVEAVANRVADL